MLPVRSARRGLLAIAALLLAPAFPLGAPLAPADAAVAPVAGAPVAGATSSSTRPVRAESPRSAVRMDDVVRTRRPAATPRVVRGSHDVTVVRVRWPGSGGSPSAATVEDTMAEVADWYDQVSSGRFRLATPRVTPVVRVGAPGRGGCLSATDRIAREAARKARVGRIEHLVLHLPCRPGYIAGLGDLGADPGRVWIFGAFRPGVVAHEIGHNLGLPHAGSLTCGGRSPRSFPSSERGLRGCDGFEYGDPFDAMGIDWPTALSSSQLDRLGWLGERRTVRSTTTVELASLGATSAGDPGVRAVVVDDGGVPWWLELRTADGLDADACTQPAAACGVQVRAPASGSSRWPSPSWLIDATPGSRPEAGHQDAAIPVGSSVTTPRGTRITVLSRTGSSARVRIEFGAGAARVPAAPAAVVATVEGRTATVTWAPPDDRGAVVTRYRVTGSDGRTRTADAIGADAARLRVGGLTTGRSYTFTVEARNERGWSPVSQPSNEIVAERVGTVADISRYDGETVYGRTVLYPSLEAGDPDDPGVATIELIVDGETVATGVEEIGSWSITWDAGDRPGTRTVWTRTTDRAGTVRESDRITVTVVVPSLRITSPSAGAVVPETFELTWLTNVDAAEIRYVDLQATWVADGEELRSYVELIGLDEQAGRATVDLASLGIPPGPFTLTLLFDLGSREVEAEVELTLG
ncbi:hypothetical protein GCM10022215_30500 [Nocardioides fonticola]|uniref:Fibronectin type-III domain-containing protein n=1 Tax=Nocardioides fonticola TaxID=450363 RepID=A0ABP7XPY3_9ACTN